GVVGQYTVRLSVISIFNDNPFEIYGLARSVDRPVGKQERMYIYLFFVAIVSSIRSEIPVGTKGVAMRRKHDSADVLLTFFNADIGFSILICGCFAHHFIPVSIERVIPTLVEECDFSSPDGHARFAVQRK